MPSASGKGKVDISKVAEYDPNLHGASGMPKEKYPKGKTTSSMVKKHKTGMKY
jgi:hypothetical protein